MEAAQSPLSCANEWAMSDISREAIEECSFRSPDGKEYKYSEKINMKDGRMISLSEVRVWKFQGKVSLSERNEKKQIYRLFSLKLK